MSLKPETRKILAHASLWKFQRFDRRLAAKNLRYARKTYGKNYARSLYGLQYK